MKKSIFILSKAALVLCMFFAAGCEKELTYEDTKATSSVKEVTLQNSERAFGSCITYQTSTDYYNYSKYKNIVISLYETFYVMYSIGYRDGKICFLIDQRVNGSWSIQYIGDKYYSITDNYSNSGCIFINVGTIDNLSQITDKIEVSNNTASKQPVSPNCGYIIAHPLEDGTLQYIRLKIKSYTTDSNGGVNSITVQYQTFEPTLL
ncbi:MAG: hypothetical protein LBN95_11160 [Prevotellaceae bacterium]|jgi:hypothetical protein|nr:hypothetical protein [Prevotellaceae bacterium]